MASKVVIRMYIILDADKPSSRWTNPKLRQGLHKEQRTPSKTMYPT
jgi:hypothetical protein